MENKIAPQPLPYPVRILILDACERDAERMVHELRRNGFLPTWDRVDTEAAFVLDWSSWTGTDEGRLWC